IGTAFDVTGVPFTVSAWIKVIDFNDYRAIFSKRDGPSSSSKRFDVGMNRSSGTVYLQGTNNLTFPYSPPLNTWTHLAVVAGAADTRLYINGTLTSTIAAFTIGTRATANTVIGGTGEGPGGDNDPFKGTLDEVRVYNRALSASEILDLFNFTGTPPVISAVAASGITSSGATITWTTDEAADSQVEYGLTAGYGQTTTLDASLVTAHSVSVSGLSPGTTYHFRVRSRDAANNLATSSDLTFTTP
ncbi:MAG TPA: LamG-like jellyroll fold domain-containing protein, partial [Terriglobia bacterium]|nr:LamG-like jellyroll fold domain-containing protein [Terriglobia bacterium]